MSKNPNKRCCQYTLVNGRYGFHRDELATLADARHDSYSVSAAPTKAAADPQPEEVKALLEARGKLRDRAVLAVLYGSGLRIAEAAKLKTRDIDARRNVLWVRQGKPGQRLAQNVPGL